MYYYHRLQHVCIYVIIILIFKYVGYSYFTELLLSRISPLFYFLELVSDG
jgi:hypothetical protein